MLKAADGLSTTLIMSDLAALHYAAGGFIIGVTCGTPEPGEPLACAAGIFGGGSLFAGGTALGYGAYRVGADDENIHLKIVGKSLGMAVLGPGHLSCAGTWAIFHSQAGPQQDCGRARGSVSGLRYTWGNLYATCLVAEEVEGAGHGSQTAGAPVGRKHGPLWRCCGGCRVVLRR